MEDRITQKFQYEKSTPGTHRFQRTSESGRKETQYIPKTAFAGDAPEEIEVVIRW